jgi:hypothetical protein
MSHAPARDQLRQTSGSTWTELKAVRQPGGADLIQKILDILDVSIFSVYPNSVEGRYGNAGDRSEAGPIGASPAARD